MIRLIAASTLPSLFQQSLAIGAMLVLHSREHLPLTTPYKSNPNMIPMDHKADFMGLFGCSPVLFTRYIQIAAANIKADTINKPAI